MGRRTEIDRLENRVRELRLRAGLSQAQLADQAGVTRQAIGAIESSQYVPNTAVALRIGRALGCPVEDLFASGDISHKLQARAAGCNRGSGHGLADELRRVHLARIGDMVIARPLDRRDGFGVADGVVDQFDAETRTLSVDLLVEPAMIDRTVVILGCDPSLGMLAGHVQQMLRDGRVLWRHSGSLDALRALRQGEAHIAGTHLWDRETGESNLPAIRQELAGMSISVIALSRWQQGLMVQAGNPRQIKGVADLVREDVAIANRAPGSGSRTILDHQLAEHRISFGDVAGYDRLLDSHDDIADAVRLGVVDAGPGILATARLHGLDFVPLQDERYDLVVPTAFLDIPAVRALLDTATGRIYRRELESLGGYDPALAGTTIAELAP